jgi:hypothetical protein
MEKKLFSTGAFMVVGKGRTVYRIEYRIGDDGREGWVRFGGLFGPDWRPVGYSEGPYFLKAISCNKPQQMKYII